MNNKYLTLLTVSALAVSAQLLFTEQVQAEIFKCVDTNAEVFYNDKPCSVTQIERKIKAVKDPEYGYIPPAFVDETEGENAQGIIIGETSNNENNSSRKAGGENQQIGNDSAQGSDSSLGSEAKLSTSSKDTLKASDSRNYAQIANTIEDKMHHERMKLKKLKLNQ